MEVIAATVASDPEKFNEAFLGIPNEAYCAWILDNEKWGGEFLLCYFCTANVLGFCTANVDNPLCLFNSNM
jgi:hypothetical protein